MATAFNKVLIVGSAPDAVRAAHWDSSSFTHILVINNAWKACPSWTSLIYPEDFPLDRQPKAHEREGKRVVTADEFVPIQNTFGGFVYAGGTMAFTAGYWALGALKPDVMAYIGCDMCYDTIPGQATHFYGSGTADPLRSDVTLQSLEAKSLRLMALASLNGCSVLNLSTLDRSRLCFPRMTFESLAALTHPPRREAQHTRAIQVALRAEAALGYSVTSGRYWEAHNTLDRDKLRDIDTLWQATASDVAMAELER